jgi:hypothetical protein
MPQPTLLADGQLGQHAPAVQVAPLAHIVPVPHVRHTVPSEAITEGTVMPQPTLAALAQLPQHSRSVGSAMPGGFTQLVPVGHIEPTPVHVRHVGDGIGAPHITALAAAQVGQHVPVAPPVQVLPAPQPIVPKPVHVRQTWPIASSTFGIAMPHATVAGSAQLPQHSCTVGMLGGTTQLVGDAHIVPRPLQVRHAWPAASTWFGTVTPHATELAAGQGGQHEPIASHVAPAGQRVPVPGHVMLPMHVAGRLMPQSTIAGATHAEVHVHVPATHASPPAHGPMQWPPQPLSSPHIEAPVQVGTH